MYDEIKHTPIRFAMCEYAIATDKCSVIICSGRHYSYQNIMNVTIGSCIALWGAIPANIQLNVIL